MKKTLLDLYQSAHKAAIAAVALQTNYAVENSALEAFSADANDPADWDYWKQQFDQRRSLMTGLKQQPAPSAKITPPTAAAPNGR